MALINLTRVVNLEFKKCKNMLACAKIYSIQNANMTSKENRDPTIQKRKPFPYETKKFTYFRSFFEPTIDRFDENTKLVVVDGNIGSGKSSFAKELAEAFDFVFLPEPNSEEYYITPYGYDIRQIDEIIPPSYKCCDINTFYKNPHHPNVAKFQFRMYMARLEKYLDALTHITNTGQGVVLERSVYGDFVFLETMHKFGYISKAARDLYKEVQENTLDELLRPHLIVYLDVPVEVCLERIKKRNNPAEVNSKVLTKEYLASIEHLYKQQYLKDMERHAELLIYDWSNYGETEVVVDDIERIDFERFTKYDSKMEDWRKEDDWEWGYFRRLYTLDKYKIMHYGYLYKPSVTELYHPTEDIIEYEEIMEKIPGEGYFPGFNRDAGDSTLFKVNHNKGWRYSPINRV